MDPVSACCFWLGATLGEPEAPVISRLGEVTVQTQPSGETTGEYALDRARALEDVVFADGRVVAISLRQSPESDERSTLGDPSGIALGMSESAVLRKHGRTYRDRSGYVWTYRFASGKLDAITVSVPARQEVQPAPSPPPLHGGTSFDDALTNGAVDEASSAHNEEAFMQSTRCNGSGEWRELLQSLVQHNGKPFDVIKAACSAGNQVREFYFDISSSFGKL